ncbi:MAG: pirin family protein [Mariprofundaceae bacterium]|nr:pirin family protein [Mariprofundaceae bacterium]
MTISIRNTAVVPEGDGVEVKRLMPLANFRNFDPFVLWDHFDISGGGFPNHPHRGFEAITYMFDGGMEHADNLGNQGIIFGGGAQRFTAGKGIVHSEMPDGRAVGIQLWINLPKRLKSVAPDYEQVDVIPVEKKDGISIRRIVGEGGAIQLKTNVEYLDVVLEQGASWNKMIATDFRGFVYVMKGSVTLNGHVLHAGQAAFVEQERELEFLAGKNSRVMWCFGKPHGEPIYQHGPFVD